jgi:MATE family multidrug resistance protein
MREWQWLARQAGTLLTGQLAIMGFGLTDTLIAGHHSPTALAVLALANSIYVSIYVALNAVIQALLPIWAGLHGAGQPVAIGHSVRQSLYLAIALGSIGMLTLGFAEPWLQWAQVPQALWPMVLEYLEVLALALWPLLGFRIYATLNQSLGFARLVTILQALGLLIKIPLSIMLTFGVGPWPGMGVQGCAWATLAVQSLMMACGLLLLRTQSGFANIQLWRWPEPPDSSILLRFVQMGVPAGLAVMVEVTSFTLMTLFIARQGETMLASHQIAASMAALLYMIPLAIGIAASARASYWLGAGREKLVHTIIHLGMGMALGMACLGAVLLVLFRQPLTQLYTSDPSVAWLASGWLAWVALYHLADAVQTVSIFLLRCYRVTLSPLLIYAGLLWGVGLLGGYWLAYEGLGPWPARPSAGTFWQMAVLALVLVAVLMVIRLRRAMKLPT